VSRATANKSLASLVSEGFLEFRKGVGTFVRRGVIDYDVRSLVSFTEKARAAGKKPSTELLTFGKLTAGETDESVRTALSVEGDSLVWEMERVRLADDVPDRPHSRLSRPDSSKMTRRCGGSERSIAGTGTSFTAGLARSNPRRPREANCDEIGRAMVVSITLAGATHYSICLSAFA